MKNNAANGLFGFCDHFFCKSLLPIYLRLARHCERQPPKPAYSSLVDDCTCVPNAYLPVTQFSVTYLKAVHLLCGATNLDRVEMAQI